MKKKLLVILAILLVLIRSNAFAADMHMVASVGDGRGRDIKIQNGITIEAIDGYISFYPKGCKTGTIYRYEFSGTAFDGTSFVEHDGYLVKKNHVFRRSFALTDKPGEYGPFTLTLRNDGQVKNWTFNIKVPEKGLDEWTSMGLLNRPDLASPKAYIDLETTDNASTGPDGSIIIESPALDSILSGFKCTHINVEFMLMSEQEDLIIELKDEISNEVISSTDFCDPEVGLHYIDSLEVPPDLKYNHPYSIWVYNENTYAGTRFTIQEEIGTHPESDQAAISSNAPSEDATAIESNSDAILVKIRDEGSVNVRQKPNADSKRVGQAAAGNTYPCLEIADNGWFKIELEDGTQGYISNKMATLAE